MRKLIIQNKENNLIGEIVPDYGGMLTKLLYRG